MKAVYVDVIKNYIKEKGLTKKEFCKSCGISSYALSNILKSNAKRLSPLLKIAKTMDVDLKTLFGF